MQTVGYQGVVDKVSAFYMKFLAQLWHTMFKKKDVIQYPRFTKLIIIDMMKFPSIPLRLDEDYYSIKDDIPLIRATDDYMVYEMVFVRVEVPMNQPQPVVFTQGTHRTTPSAHRSPTLTTSPQKKKRKQISKETSSQRKSLKVTIKQKQVVEEPGSHKENPEVIDDDDVNDDEQKDEKKDDVGIHEMGSLENRTEKMQTPIPTPLRSPRINLSSDKTLVQELVDTVSPSTATTSKDPQKKRHISSKYIHLPGALRKMCRFLHEIIPQLAERATNDLIEENLKRIVADTVIKKRDAFQSENNVIQVHPTTTTSTDTTSSADLQQQLYLKMKSNLQNHANDPALWDVLKRDDAPSEGEKRVKRHKTSKSSKSARDSSSKRSAKESTSYVTKQQHQQQEWDAWEEETIIDEDKVIPKDETPKLIIEFQNVDKRVPTIFDRARMEATLNDMLSNQFRNAEEYAYHLEQETNFMENQIVWESRQEDIRRSIPKALVFYGPQRNQMNLQEPFLEADLKEKMNRWVQKEFKNFNEDARLSIQHWKDSWYKRVYKQNKRKVRDNGEDYFSNHRITKVVRITTDQLYGLYFMEQIIVIRENDKPDSFSKSDFKCLNKNNIEDLYYLCRNKKLGIESYQIKINLTAPTLIFPSIEAHDPYLIVDKLNTGLIYLNIKNEKWVMYLVETAKFCDATLEKVLKEVKLRIFQTEFWKKPPLLGEKVGIVYEWKTNSTDDESSVIINP
ncbi:hypothetical protein Tco_0711075 [Tanacetum coccineum]